jgi:ABC-type antimicrobial peptide transport system permease subunit
MTGTFASAEKAAPAAGDAAAGIILSLPPLKSSSALPALTAGRLPSSDSAAEVLLTDSEAASLGYRAPLAALATHVRFSAGYGALLPGAKRNPAAQSTPLILVRLMTSYWTSLAQANGWKAGEFSSITLLADSGLNVEGLRQRVDDLGFQTQTFGDQFRNFEDLLGKMRIALLGLALVALLLACLGIANTMYTAVLERTKEIGVLKALGSRSHDVLLLFVAEAAVIGLAGGLIGALFAVLLGRLGNAAVDRMTQAVTSAGFDVFRLLPALRAAGQDPARALRYE